MKLDARRTIEVDLPEFLIRSLLHRVASANDGAAPEEQVELNDVVEWYLAAPITVHDIPELEAAIPGFADALSAWLNTVSYEPQ
jgi:hypothetical protein